MRTIVISTKYEWLENGKPNASFYCPFFIVSSDRFPIKFTYLPLRSCVTTDPYILLMWAAASLGSVHLFAFHSLFLVFFRSWHSLYGCSALSSKRMCTVCLLFCFDAVALSLANTDIFTYANFTASIAERNKKKRTQRTQNYSCCAAATDARWCFIFKLFGLRSFNFCVS